uniref:Putative pectinesterase inhibitor n=1 Tax=Davidia involucrata TaxID=16924 RepID=A0A5B7A1K6_DAVIN
MNPMSSFFLLLPFALCLTFQPHLIVAKQQQQQQQSNNGTSSLIARACENSSHKDFCVSVLESFPKNADPKGLVFTALRVAAKNATETWIHIKQYLSEKSYDPAVEQGLMDCEERYVDAVQQIDNAVIDLSVKAYQNIDKWVKAAITDIDTCEGEVQGQADKASEVSHNNHTLRLLLNAALGVFHALSRNS